MLAVGDKGGDVRAVVLDFDLFLDHLLVLDLHPNYLDVLGADDFVPRFARLEELLELFFGCVEGAQRQQFFVEIIYFGLGAESLDVLGPEEVEHLLGVVFGGVEDEDLAVLPLPRLLVELLAHLGFHQQVLAGDEGVLQQFPAYGRGSLREHSVGFFLMLVAEAQPEEHFLVSMLTDKLS